MTHPKPTAFERFTRTHRAHCKMNLCSLQKERTCTCGRDAAIKEVEELKKRAEMVQLQFLQPQ